MCQILSCSHDVDYEEYGNASFPPASLCLTFSSTRKMSKYYLQKRQDVSEPHGDIPEDCQLPSLALTDNTTTTLLTSTSTFDEQVTKKSRLEKTYLYL
jgi:hypothetical protein